MYINKALIFMSILEYWIVIAASGQICMPDIKTENRISIRITACATSLNQA